MFLKTVLVAFGLLLIVPLPSKGQVAGPAIRVGTYDSRAIVVAYSRSDAFRQWYDELVAERENAKAAGDEKRLKELDAQAAAQQQRFHQQAFGIASVVDLMDKIRPELGGIAKEYAVALIVSKWEVVFRDPAVEYVDVTVPLVRKFGADDKVLRTVEELMKRAPVPVAQITGH